MIQILKENTNIVFFNTTDNSKIISLEIATFAFNQLETNSLVFNDSNKAIKVDFSEAETSEGLTFATIEEFETFAAELSTLNVNFGASIQLDNIELINTGSHLKMLNRNNGEVTFMVQQRVSTAGTTSVYYVEQTTEIQVEDSSDAYQPYLTHNKSGILNNQNRYALPIDIQILNDTFIHEYRSVLNTQLDNLNIKIFSVTQNPSDPQKYNNLSGAGISSGWFISKNPYWALHRNITIETNGGQYLTAGNTALPFAEGFSLKSDEFYRFVISADNEFEFQGVEGAANPFGGTQFVPYLERSFTGEIEREIVNQQHLDFAVNREYDIIADAGYTGEIETGSAFAPYKTLQSAVDNSSANNTILIRGVHNVSTGVAFPHVLNLFGAEGAIVQFTAYDATSGDLISFEGTGIEEMTIQNITFKNAGGYGLLLKKLKALRLANCKFYNNGWDGSQLHTAAPSGVTGLLGYDSTQSELQSFYASSNASDGGAMRIQEVAQPVIRENIVKYNLRGIRLQDCGVNGAGFVIENTVSNNIESGIYLAAGGTYYGCQNITVAVNYSSYNANNGLLCIGGLNNKFSQNEVNGNWNAGCCLWGAANTTLRDCGLYDNNKSQYNGIGNTGDAKASVQINEAYNLLGTSISLNPNARFICEILDTQIQYTGTGSNTEKIGVLITSAVGALPDNEKNIIRIDDVSFIAQDYAIDFSEVDTTNLRIVLGDNSFVNMAEGNIKQPLAGMYSELPYSNHVTSAKQVDFVLDTLKQRIFIKEGIGGTVLNSYGINELQAIQKTNSVDIIQANSNKIQLRDLTLGNVYINSTIAGSNIQTLNDSLNALFSMDLTAYKEFIETEVGITPGGESAVFYYIESPDGVFHYPLFKTEAEANNIDTELSGTGSSHTHTYADDLTNTTWYMPDVSNHMSSSIMPSNGLYTAPNGETIESVVWNIQPTDSDSNYIPTFSNITYDVQEGSPVNIQYKAAGMTDTFNVTNIPSGYADNGFSIVGTAENITNGYGQAVQHVINVTKANAFGSVQGTITINVKADLAGNEFTIIEQSNGIKFTQDAEGSVLDFNTVTFNAGSTYKFYLDHYTIDSNDTLMIIDADGNAYTSGVTLNGTIGSSGAYLEFVIPADVPPVNLVWTDASGAATVTVPLIVAGSTYTVSITGITKEGLSSNQTGTNVMDGGKYGWISLNETLSAGERLVLDNAFFADFLAEAMGTNNIFAIGLKGDNWINTKEINNSTAAITGEFFKGNAYIVGVCTSGGGQVNMAIVANGQQGNTMVINTSSLHQTVCAFLEITGSGNNIRTAFGRNGNTGVTQGDESTVRYGDWNSYKGQTGEQGFGISSIDVVMSFWTYNGGNIDGAEIDWTGITEINIPTPPTSSMTNFSKAVDFGTSSSSYLQIDSSDSRWPMLKLPSRTVSAHSSDPLKTSDASGAEPFLTSCVFQPGTTAPSDNYGGTSGGRIWWCGQGSSISTNNIMLEQRGNDVFFSWGQVMAQWPNRSLENQIRIIENADPSKWYGVYIAHRGQRSSSPNAADLGAMFDIYVMSSDDSFVSLGSNISTASEWGESWNKTGQDITKDLANSSKLAFGKVGGLSTITAFSGKIASFVCHPLHTNADMPNAAEIKKVIADPIGWADDMVGTSQKNYVGGGHTFAFGSYTSALSTQIYTFGDGSNDSFSGKIRNQIHEGDTSYTLLKFVNMQATDIVNVNIPGLS